MGILDIIPEVVGAGIAIYATKTLLGEEKGKKSKSIRLLDKI